MMLARLCITIVLLLLMACRSSPQADDGPVSIEPLSDFSLYHLPGKWVTQLGDTLALETLQGKVVVASMVYTRCNAACPYLVSEMKLVETWAEKEQINDRLQYLLISFDPLADTPEQLAAFADEMKLDPGKWLLLHGDEEQVLELAALLNTKYKRAGDVHFAHSNIISVLNREGELVFQREGYDIPMKRLQDAIDLAAR